MSLEPTPTQGIGPLYTFALIVEGCENAVDPASRGAVRIEGSVFDAAGKRLRAPDATLEFLQADQFARAAVDEEGHYHAIVRKPESVALPDGRPQAPHFDVIVWVFPAIEPYLTRMYFPDETTALSVDPVLQLVDEDRRASLVAHPDGDALRFDIRVGDDDETAFLVPEGMPSLADADLPVRAFVG